MWPRTTRAWPAAGRRVPSPHPGAGGSPCVSCGQVLVENDGAAVWPIGQQGKSRHGADLLPSAAFIKSFRLGAGGVEHQQGTAGVARGGFRGGQDQRAYAMASRVAPHEHLREVRAMRLV